MVTVAAPEIIMADSLKGVIRADECYTLEAFKDRLGIQDVAWRKLRDQGLPKVQVGTKFLIIGSHAIRFFEGLAPCQESNCSNSTGDRTTFSAGQTRSPVRNGSKPPKPATIEKQNGNGLH